MDKAKNRRQCGAAHLLLSGQRLDDLANLAVCLVGRMICRYGLLQGFEQSGRREFDKRRAVSPAIRFGKRGTAGFLSVPDHCFHRQKSEQGEPLPHNQRLPQATNATVAVGKGMDEGPFTMHNVSLHTNGLWPQEQRKSAHAAELAAGVW